MDTKVLLEVPNTNGQMAVSISTFEIFNIDDFNQTKINNEHIDMSCYWGKEYHQVHSDFIRVITLMYIRLPVGKYKYIIIEKRKDTSGCFWKDYWYRFEQPIPSHIQGFYHIPYYTTHVISKDGQIIHLSNSIQSPPWVPHVYNTETYVSAPNLVCDVRVRQFKFKNDGNDVKFNFRKGAVLHRVLALAFIPYFDNPSLIEVNHIDGVKSNFNLTNLEWVTRRDNFIHALKTGLRDDCDPVVVFDWFTHQEYKFYSKSEASRFIGVTSTTMSNKIRPNDQTTIAGRYSVKDDKPNNPWKYKTFKEAVNKAEQYVEALNIFTKETIRVLGAHNLPPLLEGKGINRPMLSFLLQRLNRDGIINRPYNGYMFRYLADEIPFPILSPEEIIFYRKLKERGTAHERCPFMIFKNGKFYDVAVNKEEVREILNIGRWTYERLMRGQPHETYTDPSQNVWAIKKIYKYHSFLDRYE